MALVALVALAAQVAQVALAARAARVALAAWRLWLNENGGLGGTGFGRGVISNLPAGLISSDGSNSPPSPAGRQKSFIHVTSEPPPIGILACFLMKSRKANPNFFKALFLHRTVTLANNSSQDHCVRGSIPLEAPSLFVFTLIDTDKS